MRKPCKECPYRKDSMPGYLGESSYNPNEFLSQLELPNLHPCHMQVDWDSEENNIDKADVCAGAMQFCKNTMKMLRNPSLEKIRQKMTVDSSIVFDRRYEFINYHSE